MARPKQLSLASVAHALGRARREGPAAVLACLDDLRIWNSAGPREQALAAEAVSSILGGPFRLIGLEESRVSDETVRVAVFRRRVSVTGRGPGLIGRGLERLLSPNRRFAMDFLLIPGGTFRMGALASGVAAESQSDTRPVVRVQPFLLARNPVIQRAWDFYGGEDQRRVRDPERPIHGICWEDAEQWLAGAGGRLRFPTEAEWEWAARAGGESTWPTGENPPRDLIATGNDSDAPKAPARRERGPFGLIDLSGNVGELCWDEFFDSHEGRPCDQSARGDQAGYDKSRRVVKGGGYERPETEQTCTARRAIEQDKRERDVGLRPARSLNLDELWS